MSDVTLTCEIGPCRQAARWVPKFILRPGVEYRNDTPAEIIGGVLVCDGHRRSSTVLDLLGPKQRAQVEAVFRVAEKAKPDWERARIDWLDLRTTDLPPDLLPNARARQEAAR